MLVQKLKNKLATAIRVNNQLAETIKNGGGGATGLTATMFENASKDLMKIQNLIRSELNRGNVTVDEYKMIMSA